MRGNVIIVKNIFIIQLFTGFLLTLSAEPYKPYPILWVHGINSNSGTWGANAYEISDGKFNDSIVSVDHGDWPTFEQFLGLINPYVIEWDKVDKSYTKPGDVNDPPGEGTYPNKTFLEVINFDDNRGSIDPHPNYPNFNGQGDELWHRINEVMEEYYGEEWQENRNVKIILFRDSTGTLAVRQAIVLFLFFCSRLV